MGFGIQRNLGNQNVNVTLQAMQEVQQDDIQLAVAQRESTADNLQTELSETVNPFAAAQKKQKDIKAQKSRVQKMLKAGEKPLFLPITDIKNSADQFQRRNPELLSNTLLALIQKIKPDDSKEEILAKLLESYPDVSLADEALEFLIENTLGELSEKLKELREDLNQERGREITAGRNINIQARQATEKGLGTASSMRDMYRDITGNPRDATTLFEELSKKYAFKDLSKVVNFLLHSLGADMKSKGPSIERGELHTLFTEARTLQAILGVYRFYRGRMHLIQTQLEKYHIPIPPELNFESISKAFMNLAAERYPATDKVLQKVNNLGIANEVLAKITVLSQFRDGIREVAGAKIFKSIEHQRDLHLAILETLEDLEDELEEVDPDDNDMLDETDNEDNLKTFS